MRRTTPLLLTAVAIVLGVLAMHAASAGPHSPHSGVHTMASQVAAPGGPLLAADQGTGTDDDVMAMGAAVEVSVDGLAARLATSLSDLAGPELPTEPSAAMTAMCAAMLFSLAVALGFGMLVRSRDRTTSPSPLLSVPRCGQLTRAPPPDLLTRLCVLRT